MQKKVNIGKKAKVSLVWKVKPSEYTKENENSIKALFAKKYDIPVTNIKVEKQFQISDSTDTGLNYENIKNITDPEFQHQLFKQYLIENDINNYDFDEIIKIDSLINSQIDYDQYEKGKKYSIKWLDWSNFLSYGNENHFDFTDLNGLILLNGEPANKSGKSTFAYDLLHFLFFGETKSGKAKNESGQFNLGALFNSYLPEETELKVEGCISIDGVDYIIKRTLKRPAKSKKELRTATQKVEYFMINAAGEKEELVEVTNLKEDNTRKTNKVIKETIGSEKDFDLIISANAKDLDDLISLKNDERGKLLSRWIGLSCLEDKNAKAKEMWNKNISVGRVCDTYNREDLKRQIEELTQNNSNYKVLIEDKNSKIQESQKRIDTCVLDKERYISDKKPIDSKIENIGDLTTLERKLEVIINNGKKDNELKKDLEDELKTIGDCEYSDNEYQELSKQKEDLITKISTIKANITNLKEKNTQLKNSEYCPTCHRKFENIDNSGIIADNEKNIKELIAQGVELSKTKDTISTKMCEIDNKRIEFKKKNNLEVRIAALETKLTNGRTEYKEIKDLIKKVNDQKENIRYNNELDAKINILNETIKTEESIKLRLNNEVVSMTKDIEMNNASIKNLESLIVKIKNEEKIEKDWKLYLKLIGKDGISKIVLKNTLPIINAEINRLLDDVTDFNVEVVMNEKNDVNFYLERNNVKYNLAGASGLEETQAALALRVVLGSMSMLSSPDFLLLDEVLGSVAKENYDDMKKLYDRILEKYTFIFHICHVDLDWYDGVVTIYKDNNNISHIKEIRKNV